MDILDGNLQGACDVCVADEGDEGLHASEGTDGVDMDRCGSVDRSVVGSGSFRGGRGLDRAVGAPKADHGGRHIGQLEKDPRSEIVAPSKADDSRNDSNPPRCPIDSPEEAPVCVDSQLDVVPEVVDARLRSRDGQHVRDGPLRSESTVASRRTGNDDGGEETMGRC